MWHPGFLKSAAIAWHSYVAWHPVQLQEGALWWLPCTSPRKELLSLPAQTGLWLLGVNHGVSRSSQACLKDTPAVLETVKALVGEHSFVVLAGLLLKPSPPSFETRFLRSCPTHLVTRMALNF